ncbi:MAG: type II secretion system protein GspM [Halanaerobiaceae bacterium]
MFSNLSTREKVIIVLGLMVVGITVFWFYYYVPIEEEIADLETQLNNKNNEVMQTTHRINQIPDMEDELAEIERKRKEYKEKEKSVSDLLIFFNNLAVDYNLKLEGFNPQREEESITLNLELAGDYRQISEMFVEARRNIDRLQLDYFELVSTEDGALVKAEINSVYQKYNF